MLTQIVLYVVLINVDQYDILMLSMLYFGFSRYDQVDGADNGQTTVVTCAACHNAITKFNARNKLADA
jgi:hypothetical protein